jgi:chemotaxis protein MotA
MITDNLRNIISGGIDATQLEGLLDAQIELAFEEAVEPAHALNNMSDGIPGLGIVAAVQGIIITMGYLSEPPEVLGHHVGAALVGTFLGVLLCYGFVGPIARNLEGKAKEFRAYLGVLKVLILAVAQGSSPQIVREFGRAMIPGDIRPTVQEMEKLSGK